MSSIRNRRAKLGLEALEDRTVPSFMVGGGPLNVVLAPANPAPPNTWYQDRYAPASFGSDNAPDGRTGVVHESISAGAMNGSRLPQYNSTFYDFQGLKYDLSLAKGTTYLAVDLYVSSSWSGMAQHYSKGDNGAPSGSDPAASGSVASLWAVGVDASGNTITNYPEIGFNNQTGGFQVKDRSTGGWQPVTGFNGYDQWYRIGFSINSQGQFDYFVNGQQVLTDASFNPTTPPAPTAAFSNLMLQGYNAGNSYDIYWDNLSDSKATVVAQGANVSATAGAPFSGTVATFTTNQLESAKAFTAVINWGDGSTPTAGVITYSNGIFTVTGSHNYGATAGASYALSVQISSPTTESATANATATVTLASGMTGDSAFWLGSNGQALINSFNGGSSSKALGNWLSSTLPNLFGPGAGTDNLNSQKNATVLQYLKSLDAQAKTGDVEAKLQEQALVLALNVYATTSTLGGTDGAKAGFTVTAAGLGASSYSVGIDGAAFGVANNTTETVNYLLAYVDSQFSKRPAYNGNTTLQVEAVDLFASLNQAGSSGIG
jgi:hypothetical protein